MDKERYHKVDLAGAGLTADELAEGWHFCYDWDELLVGPPMPEYDGCGCSRNKAKGSPNVA